MTLIPEIKPQQSIELLKALHILTRDGKLNQDTRRKLKQVYHLYHFIEPLLTELMEENEMLWKLKEMEYVEKIADRIGEITISGSGNVISQLKDIFVE